MNGQLDFCGPPRRARGLPTDDGSVAPSAVSNLALASALEAATQNRGPWEGFIEAARNEALRQLQVAKVRVSGLAQEIRARQKAAKVGRP